MRNDERARLEYGGGVTSSAKSFMAKTAAVLLGGAMLISAFIVSLAFFAIAAVVVVLFGGYLWWKTRAVRRQLREQFARQMPLQQSQRNASGGDVIEGVVVSRRETLDQRDRPPS